MQAATRRCLIACVLLVAAGVGVNVVHARRSTPAQIVFDPGVVPLEASGFVGIDSARTGEIERLLEAQAVLSRDYRRAEAPPVRFTVVFGTDWRAIHAPTGCYPAQGWNVDSDEECELPAPPRCPHDGPLHARFLQATKEGRRECALFLYAYPGGTTADWAREGWNVATGRSGLGGLVVIAATAAAGEAREDGVAAARRRLAELMSALYVPVVSFWGAPQVPSAH